VGEEEPVTTFRISGEDGRVVDVLDAAPPDFAPLRVFKANIQRNVDAGLIEPETIELVRLNQRGEPVGKTRKWKA
jgi:hypothetical protein